MKCAFITGASRGIGKEIAFALSEAGYRCVLVATNKQKLEDVAQELTTRFHLAPSLEPLIFPLDISQPLEVETAVKEAEAITHSFDVLFNSAGIVRYGTSEMSYQDLFDMLTINCIGTFNCIRAIVPYMKKTHSGYIFNVSSRAGKIGISTIGGYAASKFGVAGLSESLFNELVSYGIKVTTLFPGYVDTDMASGRSSIANEDKIPTSDIAKIVLFLLSLSSNCYIKEIIPECRKTLELMNESLLKGKK